MTYSVLLLGASGTIGTKIAAELAIHKNELQRVAYLTPLADAGLDKEEKYKALKIERIVGSLEDTSSYQGFNIVVSAVGDALCASQPKYMDAAFAAGVKHFYPAEYGADISRSGTRGEAYFADKEKARQHVEQAVKRDPSLGYTYIMTGLFSDFMLKFNILFLADDRKSANFTGSPHAKLSTTLSDDVAKVIVASLLPSHLKSLAGPRHVRFAGTTLEIRDLFAAIEKVLGHPIDVTYGSKEESYVFEEEQRTLGNEFLWKFTSARRSIGFGGSELSPLDNDKYPEIKPTAWLDVVKSIMG